MNKLLIVITLLFISNTTWASFIYVPMNHDNLRNHLKAYGIVYFGLEAGLKSK